MSDTILRQISMMELIPRYPAKTFTNEIKDKLSELGYEATLRTIQRDLQELSRLFPIVSDERSQPFGWSWKKDAKGYESPAMDPIQALTFSLAAQYLEPLMPKANFKRIEAFFSRAESVLTGNEKSKLHNWRKRVKVIPENIRFKEPKVSLEIRQKIYHAVYEGIQIKALYKKRGSKTSDKRHIHPLGIVIKGSMHYLICMMDEDQIEPRYLPLQRFEKVKEYVLSGLSIKVIDALTSGQDVTVELPHGKACLASMPDKPLLLVAAGTGFAQMKSLVDYLRETRYQKPVKLFWGVRKHEDMYLRSLAQQWQEEWAPFSFLPVGGDDEDNDWGGHHDQLVRAVLASGFDWQDVEVHASGSPTMVYTLMDALVEAGLPEQAFFSDVLEYAPRS